MCAGTLQWCASNVGPVSMKGTELPFLHRILHLLRRASLKNSGGGSGLGLQGNETGDVTPAVWS